MKPTDEWGYYSIYGWNKEFSDRTEALQESERLLKVCSDKQIQQQIQALYDFNRKELKEFIEEFIEETGIINHEDTITD